MKVPITSFDEHGFTSAQLKQRADVKAFLLTMLDLIARPVDPLVLAELRAKAEEAL